MNSYGDMPAHNFLWRECEKSSEDVAARLAVIPLVQVFPVFVLVFFPFRLRCSSYIPFLLWSLSFHKSFLNPRVSWSRVPDTHFIQVHLMVDPKWNLFQEARGLDAGPRLVQKLVGFGDLRTSHIVAKIAEEEMAHVAVGLYWFLHVCKKINRAPCATFKGK